MAVIPLVKAPDPRLKQISQPVRSIDRNVRRLMDDMLETMYANNGIGLAAIQIGVAQRVVVMDLDPKGPNSKPLYVLNPVIVSASAEQSTYQEGCLSVPEFWEDVHRPARLTVEYMDDKGETRQVEADGLMATCFQHEIDHINGKLFIDHLSRLKRSIALRKSAKAKRQDED
jgi:peptide deformylase